MSGDEKKLRRLQAVTERRQQEGYDKVLAGILEAAKEADMQLAAHIEELRGLYVNLNARLKDVEAEIEKQKKQSGIITL